LSSALLKHGLLGDYSDYTDFLWIGIGSDVYFKKSVSSFNQYNPWFRQCRISIRDRCWVVHFWITDY